MEGSVHLELMMANELVGRDFEGVCGVSVILLISGLFRTEN